MNEISVLPWESFLRPTESDSPVHWIFDQFEVYFYTSMECFFQKNLKVNFYNEPITEVVIILYRLFIGIYIRE